jgi:polyferredoxin
VLEQNLNNNLNWVDVWKPQIFNIFILCIFIIACSLILYFKNWFVKRRTLYPLIRMSFLIFCLVWVGWTVGAQLTIVNIFNYIQLIFVSNFNYSVIVFDPLIVIISIVTFLSFIILGRGFFCGWLCPFGALQEIINFISQKLGIIQLKIKENFHRKLIYSKYIILSVIILFLFIDLDTALIMTEVEPFKTAITLQFLRDWPYVVYAILLLIASAFISRFYCRYICPLGAVLAIGGKFRIFNILLRRKECGKPCHLCENSCPTQAIKNNGKIDMNECFYCLDCQEEYYDDHRCPPLVAIRREIYR